jgi:hypothetical protein
MARRAKVDGSHVLENERFLALPAGRQGRQTSRLAFVRFAAEEI